MRTTSTIILAIVQIAALVSATDECPVTEPKLDLPLSKCNCAFGSSPNVQIQGGGPFWNVYPDQASINSRHAQKRLQHLRIGINMGRFFEDNGNEFYGNDNLQWALKEMPKGLSEADLIECGPVEADTKRIAGNNWLQFPQDNWTPLEEACGFKNNPTPGYTSFKFDTRAFGPKVNGRPVGLDMSKCYCLVTRPWNSVTKSPFVDYTGPGFDGRTTRYFGNCLN